MFKFNFFEEPNPSDSDNVEELHNDSKCFDELSQIESGIFSYKDMENKLNTFVKNEIQFKKFLLNEKTLACLDYVDASSLEIDKNDSLSKINETHDLIAGQYEGGLKVVNLLLILNGAI